MEMKHVLTATLLVTALTGCAHGVMRGSVAMKTGEREAHVCMGNAEVKPGDKVKLYTNRCTRGPARTGAGTTCEKVYLGNGTVTQNLNEHYSVVTFDEGVRFEEGTFVEKM